MNPMDELTKAVRQYADELEQMRNERAREMERLRTLKYMRYPGPLPGQGNQAAASATYLWAPGPVQQGYTCDLRIISGSLSASDSVVAFIGENAVTGFRIGYAAAPGAAPAQPVFVIYIPKSSGLLLDGGESLFLQTSGAGNITSVRASGWQVAGTEAGKLF